MRRVSAKGIRKSVGYEGDVIASPPPRPLASRLEGLHSRTNWARLYGRLRSRGYARVPILHNFVTTLDGVRFSQLEGTRRRRDSADSASGEGDGLLRAVADVVIWLGYSLPPIVGMSGWPQPSFPSSRLSIGV